VADMSDDKRLWLRSVLGIELPEDAAGGDLDEGSDLEKGPRRSKKSGDNGGSTDTQTASSTDSSKAKTGKEAKPLVDIATPLKALKDEIAALKNLGFNTAQMEADIADFAKSETAANGLPDVKAQKKALEQIKKRVEETLEHAKALSKSLKKVMGDKKGNPDEAQKSAIYKKALEDLYGLKIEVPEGMTNTHFDRVFDMFGTVPKGDVKQSKLKKLAYTTDPKWSGSGAYGSARIKMGDFGDATDSEDYEIDGKTIPANSFGVTTLHEIGHSVDEKNGIMKKHQGKDGCGGWRPETVDKSVTDAFLAELKKKVAMKTKIKDAVLKGAVTAALKDGTTAEPEGIDHDDWTDIVAFLTDNCLKVRTKAKPWFEDTQIVVDGRVYQEAYAGQWWSYTFAARAQTKVNDYQWRSPFEWFAEVYAISWLSKKKPPSGVDSAMMPYMWKG
jgi:hypothetical protein